MSEVYVCTFDYLRPVYLYITSALIIYIYCEFMSMTYQLEYIYINLYWLIGLVGRVFANGQGDLCSISCHVIPKTLKMVLDTSAI